MASKLVTDRQKSARAVAAAADTHAPDIAKGIQTAITPYLHKGESLPDVALLIRLVGRKLAADNAALIEADRAHEKELSDDAAPREARDSAATKVRAALIDIRAAVEATYGVKGLTLLGLDAAIPVDPSVLAVTATTVSKALHDPDLKLPKPKRAGMKLDRKELAAEIDAEIPALQKALADVAREDREREVTQGAKNEAMSRNDATFSAGAGWITASAVLAGLDAIAAKVRPSTRSPGRTAAEDEGAGGENPA
jgi:hypothetical protein